MPDHGFADGLIGIVLDGRYRLDAVLGEGGMGSVFRAHHLAMDRKVAVKLLKPHLTQDATQLERFAREARSTQRVDSPHAVKVLDFGITPQRDYYMVLEYLDGRSVQRELDVDGAFAPARAIHVARQALHALAAAHAIGLVHRDLKPDNILLMRVDRDPDYTKLLDFGVAKLMEGAASSSRSALALTQQGMVFGTPEFMSPEQACGHPLDGRSDVYSLAATLFAMLTGCALFEAASQLEWLTHHVRTPPPRLAMLNPALAAYPALDDLLQTCLAKRREDRPASAHELDRALEALQLNPVSVAVAPQGVERSADAAVIAPVTHATRSTFSASSYVPAFAPASAPTTGGLELPAPHRGRYLVLAALLVVGVIIVTIVVATRDRRPLGLPIRSAKLAAPRDASAIATPSDAAAALATPSDVETDAAPPVRVVDAGRPTRITDAAVRVAPPPPPMNEHLRNAEAARISGSRLRQLAEADLALQAEPTSQRARYLLGDALIATGDLERGCKYLRTLAKYQPAKARADAAGCP